MNNSASLFQMWEEKKKLKASQRIFPEGHTGTDKVNKTLTGVNIPSHYSVVMSFSINVTSVAAVFGFYGLSGIFTATGINLLV